MRYQRQSAIITTITITIITITITTIAKTSQHQKIHNIFTLLIIITIQAYHWANQNRHTIQIGSIKIVITSYLHIRKIIIIYWRDKNNWQYSNYHQNTNKTVSRKVSQRTIIKITIKVYQNNNIFPTNKKITTAMRCSMIYLLSHQVSKIIIIINRNNQDKPINFITNLIITNYISWYLYRL